MKDLGDIRQKIKEIIIMSENVPILAENFIGPNKVSKMIEEKIKSCPAYIGIFHKNWGDVPTEDNPSKLPFTAMEYEEGKIMNIPIQIFISTLIKGNILKNLSPIPQISKQVRLSVYYTRNVFF